MYNNKIKETAKFLINKHIKRFKNKTNNWINYKLSFKIILIL